MFPRYNRPPPPERVWIPYATWIERYGECSLPVQRLRLSLFAVLLMLAAAWGLYGWSQNWGDPEVYREVFGKRMRWKSKLMFGPWGVPMNTFLLLIMAFTLRMIAPTRFDLKADGLTVRPFGIHVPAANIAEISEPAYWYKNRWWISVRRRNRRWFEFPGFDGAYKGPKPEDAPDILRPGTTAWTIARGGPWVP